ncbi:hypothetical protein [Streptomyces europaeiscabiei]|uniref:hypothetical protein n=1 Tax=Streptomyces europaeiscabiei TaxID=146819 RepID=UPI0039906895
MSYSTYGHQRVQAQTQRWGVAAGVKPVRRLIRELGLLPGQPRPKRFNLTQAAAGQVPEPVKSSSRTLPTSRPGKAG